MNPNCTRGWPHPAPFLRSWKRSSERDAYSNANSGMAPVVHVIAIVDVFDTDVVGLVPVGCPIFRPRVNHREPVASVVESGVIVDHNDGDAVDAKPASTAEVLVETVFWNALPVVAAALPPVVMFALPIMGAMDLPGMFCLAGMHLARVFRPTPLRMMYLLFASVLFVPLLRPARLMSFRMLRDRASVLLLMVVLFLPGLLSAFMPMLCRGRSSRPQTETQY